MGGFFGTISKSDIDVDGYTKERLAKGKVTITLPSAMDNKHFEIVLTRPYLKKLYRAIEGMSEAEQKSFIGRSVLANIEKALKRTFKI